MYIVEKAKIIDLPELLEITWSGKSGSAGRT